MAEEQILDGPESLPKENTETAEKTETKEESNWEKKYQEDFQNWDKRSRDKDANYNQTAEKLKAYEKYAPALDEINKEIERRKSAENAKAVQDGNLNPLKEELSQQIKKDLEQEWQNRFQAVSAIQEKAEADATKFELGKVFTGEVKEKYGSYAEQILNDAFARGGVEAFKSWANNAPALLRQARGAYLEAQEKLETEKSQARKTNSEQHRKAMAPTARMSTTSEANESSKSLMQMPMEELERLHIAAGGRRLNIK